MFGHQDSNNNAASDPNNSAVNGILSHPIAPQTVAPTAGAPADDGGDDQFILTDVSTPPASPAPAGAPATPSVLAPTPEAPTPEVPAVTGPEHDAHSDINAGGHPGAPTADSGLLELKQSALHELSPLLDHLEQTAEERFRTMMMMIQASDDQSLLREAYEAAQQIEDKKARAQALLDIVNEINYFTQQPADGGAAHQ
jgi:hypothetical protein